MKIDDNIGSLTNLEEAAQRYSDDWENITGLEYENEYPEAINKLDFMNGAKWQAERSYSEEEVFNLLLKYQNEYSHANNETGLKYWFEQFKKK